MAYTDPQTISDVLDDLNIATAEYMKELVRVISSDNYLNKRMLGKSEAVDGGDFIKVPLRYGKENFASMAEYDAVDLAPKDILDEARYHWSHLNGNISLSEKKMKVQNAGKRKLLNLVKVRMQNLADTFKDGMSDMLFQTTSGDNDPASIVSICGTQDNTVGGIDAGNVPAGSYDWNPQKVTATGASFDNMQTTTGAYYMPKILRNIVGKQSIGSDKPSLILCNQVSWDAYEQVLSTQKRFDSAYRADAGFDVLKFRHTDVVVDNHTLGGKLDPNSGTPTSSTMYVLNEDYLGFYHASGFNFKNTPWKRAEMQHVYFTELDWYGGLACSRRDMQGHVIGMPVDYSNVSS